MSLYDSIIIVGSYGMLAQAVAAVLRSRQLPFKGVDRDTVDITSPEAVKQLFAEQKPTLVINCAAHTKVDLCEDEEDKANAINGDAVGALAQAAREHHSCLVHYSTDFVFDGTSRRPYRTEDAPNPLSAYGRSKLLGETLLQQNAPPRWLILRTAWLYGRGGPSFPRTIVERGRQGGALKVVNDQIGSPTYTGDLAQATFDLLDAGQHGLWHVTNAGQASWFEFAAEALKEFGVSATVAPTTTAEWLKTRPKQAIRPAYSVLDVEPIAKAVGKPMRPWGQGLKDFCAAVSQSGF